jgi:uroporphyrinogen decarboxylase
MDLRENTLQIVRFGKPERIVMTPPLHHISYRGCHHENFDGTGSHSPVGMMWTDIWGAKWRKALEGVMGFPVEFPLPNPRALHGYTWPDPNDERICSKIYLEADQAPADGRLLAGHFRCTLWERIYKLVGMEDLMVYFYTEAGFVKEICRRVMDFQLGVAKHYLQVGIEFALLGDDLGSQMGPLLSPHLIDEFFVPEYRRIFRLLKDRNVLIGFHSCGSIEFMLEQFIELGVNVLNPIQASANDLERIRSVTQDRMALQGGVSSATIMDGPVDKIRREAVLRMWQLGRNGGYFCREDQGLPFPEEHREALEEAVATFGGYPIKPPAELEELLSGCYDNQ